MAIPTQHNLPTQWFFDKMPLWVKVRELVFNTLIQVTLTSQWHRETPFGLIMALVQNGSHRKGKHVRVIKNSLIIT